MKWLNHTTCQCCTLKTNLKKTNKKTVPQIQNVYYKTEKLSTDGQESMLKKTALKKMFALQFCDLKCPFHQVNSTI